MLTREEGEPQGSQAPENSSYCDRLVRYALNSQKPEKLELPFTISAPVIDIQFTAQNGSREAHCSGEGLGTEGNAAGVGGLQSSWGLAWGGHQWGEAGEAGRPAAVESPLCFQHGRVHHQQRSSL